MTPGYGRAIVWVQAKGGVMAVLSHPKRAPEMLPLRPALRVESRRAAKLYLLTCLVGNASCWMLWAAVAVSADDWYWWLVVPLAGWTIVLALHLWRAYVQTT